MRISRRLAVLVATVPVLGFCAWLVAGHYEHQFLTTGRNGVETPATVGVAFERVDIASADRHLDGYLVRAPARCTSPAALLIFHGVGETISYWPQTQRFLHDRCVSSLVFDYSGHGNSSRPGSVANLNADAASAWDYFVARFAGSTRRCVLGHSMGNGPMLAGVGAFRPAPACVVVANAFSSLRELGVHAGAPRMLMAVVPDDWDNVVNVTNNHAPLLVVQSDADTVIPLVMGEQVFHAAAQPKRLLILHGFRHNALYRHPTTQWWAGVIQFVEGTSS